MVSSLKTKNYIIIYSFMEQRCIFFYKYPAHFQYDESGWELWLSASKMASLKHHKFCSGVIRKRCERNQAEVVFHWKHRSLCFMKVNERSSDLRNQSFKSDLYNESIDLVHKTSLNDSQISHSLIRSAHKAIGWVQNTWNIAI